jgi:hypothetical protein
MIARRANRLRTGMAGSSGNRKTFPSIGRATAIDRPIAKLADLAGQTGHHHPPAALWATLPRTTRSCQFRFVRVPIRILAERPLARGDGVHRSATDPHFPGSFPLRRTCRQ